MVKRLWPAWLLWIMGGPLGGLHLLYVQRDYQWLLAVTTLSGLGLRWLLDLCRMKDYVREANMRHPKGGPHHRVGNLMLTATFVQAILTAWLYEAVFFFALDALAPPAALPIVRVLGRALGVWLCFSTDFLRASLQWTIAASAASHGVLWCGFMCLRRYVAVQRSALWIDNLWSLLGSLFTAGIACYTRSFEPTLKISKRLFLRVMILSMFVSMYYACIGSALYHHMELPDPHHKNKSRKVKEAFAEFFQSDTYQSLQLIAERWKKVIQTEGLMHAFDTIREELAGNGDASQRWSDLALLGLQKNADKATIRKRWHELAKQHHPDVQTGTGEEDDQMQKINAAYARLTGRSSRVEL